jgi:hypothetical protein
VGEVRVEGGAMNWGGGLGGFAAERVGFRWFV